MPKEVVYGDNLPYGTKEDPGHARSVVEVSWSREGEHVQLASRCVEAATEATYVANTSTASNYIPHTDGFYVDLNRQGINRLIRNLRRARDQAFGRDE